MIHSIYKPDSVIFRRNIYNLCIQVKWHLICENIRHLAFFVLKNNLCTWVYNLNASAEVCKRIFFLAAVKHNHIRITNHIHKNGFHILHIYLECACIYTGNVLFNSPACRELHLLKFAYQPHSIIFHNHTLRLMDNIQCLKALRCKIFFFLNNLDYNIIFCKSLFIVLFLSLFAENEKCLSLCTEVILLEGKAKERGLAAFQEAGYEINRYCNFIHLQKPPCIFLN